MKHSWIWGCLVACLLWACGDDNGGNPVSPPPAATLTPTATRLAQPTPTPTRAAEHHEHILLGSHHSGGGHLMAHFDFEHSGAKLTEQQCIGGTGHACTGGTIVYSGMSPAFETVGEEEAEEHLQPLLPGTRVRLEIVEISPGVQLQLGDLVLNHAGRSAVLGDAPFHEHGAWQLVLPAGVDPRHSSYTVTFRFLAEGTTYEPSVPYTLRLLVAGEHHGAIGGVGE